MIEKERKFLVNQDINLDKYKNKSKLIKQGYLLLGSNKKQLRIRIINKKSYICYKYNISKNEKAEYEYKIPLVDGLELYNSCDLKLEKNRFSKKINKYVTMDIDFYKNNQIVIELEYICSYEDLDLYIKSNKELKKLIGNEITGVSEYSNINFAKKYVQDI